MKCSFRAIFHKQPTSYKFISIQAFAGRTQITQKPAPNIAFFHHYHMSCLQEYFSIFKCCTIINTLHIRSLSKSLLFSLVPNGLWWLLAKSINFTVNHKLESFLLERSHSIKYIRQVIQESSLSLFSLTLLCTWTISV
jgi:hypothetical protein